MFEWCRIIYYILFKWCRCISVKFKARIPTIAAITVMKEIVGNVLRQKVKKETIIICIEKELQIQHLFASLPC